MSLHPTEFGREGRREGGIDGLDHVRTLKETCQLLGVSLSTLKRRIDDGSLKTIRLSERRVGVLDSERARFLSENAT
jgi:predicted DNA-binding transcriptional regulator AlpA